MTGNGKFHLHLISDSTGDTLHALARAALAPFRDQAETAIHLAVFVRTARDLDVALAEVRANPRARSARLRVAERLELA